MLLGRRWWRRIGQGDSVHHFPIIGRYHFNRIPRTAIEKSAVWALARTFLATDAEVWVDFYAAEWRMIFIGHPEHTGFDGTVLDAGW